MTILLSVIMTTQHRKNNKCTCYLFTINRIESQRDLYAIHKLLTPMTEYLVIGLEPKANIGSNHIQGCLKLDSHTTLLKISQPLKDFLKTLEKNPSVYFTKIKSEADLLRTTMYSIKYRNAIINLSKTLFIFIYKNKRFIFDKTEGQLTTIKK